MMNKKDDLNFLSYCEMIFYQICFFLIVIFDAFNTFLASGNFCGLLITFANSLDLDQD